MLTRSVFAIFLFYLMFLALERIWDCDLPAWVAIPTMMIALCAFLGAIGAILTI